MRPGYDENSLYTFKEKNTSHSSPPDSEELFQLADENEQTNPFVKVIKKAIQYSPQKGQGGYFTKSDLEYTLLMRLNEGWNTDKVEQTFNALLEEGKIMKSYHNNENLHSN